jgi:hypothetical protein
MKTIPNSYPILREGKIISTTDPEKLGRVQIKVYPELSEIPDADTPWCFPFSGGIHGKSFGVPLKDQLISCIVWNKYWNEITFLPFNITKPTEHLFDKWKDERKPKITDMADDPEEEHFVVEEYEDGFTAFHDTKNSQHGFLHPKEMFVMINKDGDIFMQSIKKLTFHNKDSDLFLEADSETGDVTFKTKGGADGTVDKDWNSLIKGTLTEEAGKDVTQTYKAKQTGEVTGDATFDYKANWKVTVTGNTEIRTTGDTKIESSETMNVKSSGPCTVESSAMTTVKGSSMVVVDAPILNFKGQKSNGTVVPSGSGVCCALPVCVAAGIPQSG